MTPGSISRMVLTLLVLLTQGCMIPRKPETPIPSRFYEVTTVSTKTLVIFLPGRGDDLTAFEKAGFIDALKASGTSADAVAVDSHLGYFMAGQLAERMRADIIEHYQERGYSRFILVGTSLGGYGALWLENEYPDSIHGMLLIAPYLGPKKVIDSVKQSDSLAEWKNQLGRDPSTDEYPWVWLEALTRATGQLEDKLLLAYGEKDKFRDGAEIVGRLMSPGHVIRADGTHNWRTWQELWIRTLRSSAWAEMSRQDDG